MNRKQAIEILKNHQDWRTDQNVPPKTKMQNPKDVSKAINFAINQLDNLNLISILAVKMGELIYLRDNEYDYFVKKAYEKKIKAIVELLEIIPNEEKVII